MATFTDYLRNKLNDWYLRNQAFVPPATHYFGLLTTTKGPRANSTPYALNDTISVLANDGKLHLYKCTSAGNSAADQAALYPGVADEVIADGGATFTEQTSALRAGTAAVEPSGGSYARVAVASSLANFSGTQGDATTAVSNGTTGKASNNSAITFPAPTADWKYVWAVADYDAANAGNLLEWTPLATAKTVNNGDSAPSFAAASLAFYFDK